MKPFVSICAAALLGLGLVTQAAAGPGRDRGPGFDRDHGKHFRAPAYQHPRYAPPPPRYHYDRRHNRHDWVGPAAVLTIGGLALGSALYYNAPPQPVVVYQNSAPPPGNWFYCRSSGQYYPYTQACPEGWVTVPPR